ncbi:hypothetical protein Nepgr_026405 [Nepenthes gracilis]|uniref:Josephin-like protein n=1 Tax=Nepenthes gracilis TaxID=150966 RepID=A0AAD3T879_NEPGR|nr:hypothetical protein Nepgr_026405 [Nepenthes gracilis]
MERQKEGRRFTKSHCLCIPLPIKINVAAATDSGKTSTPAAATAAPANRRLWAVSLPARFLKAVLRLITVTALSKATNRIRTAGRSPDNHRHARRSCNYHPDDLHRSEAMADCIEFIKKSAAFE